MNSPTLTKIQKRDLPMSQYNYEFMCGFIKVNLDLYQFTLELLLNNEEMKINC